MATLADFLYQKFVIILYVRQLHSIKETTFTEFWSFISLDYIISEIENIF